MCNCLLNFFKVSVTVNLMLCIFITACAIISSGLRIIHKGDIKLIKDSYLWKKAELEKVQQ